MAKLVKIGQKTKFILILLDNYSLQMYRFRTALHKFILPSTWLLLFGICLLAPYFPELVTKYYTQGLFRYWTMGLRFALSFLPFAIGELVYIILLIILIYNIITSVISIKNRSNYTHYIPAYLLKFVWFCLKVFVVFELIWGLNYLQPDPTKAYQLTVNPPKNAQIALDEMTTLTYEFAQELNKVRQEIDKEAVTKMKLTEISARVQAAYARMATQKKELDLKYAYGKSAIFSSWGDYIGYLAFYQPITGEAILRSDLPVLTQPFTIAHEMAHQLGYASETEANFIAFVVATENEDPLLKYAMLLQMFTYAQDAQLMLIAGNKGFAAWEAQIKMNKALLNPEVLKDRTEIRAFFAARAGKQIKASSQLYDQFLQWNRQSAGLASYADVLKWVRAYRLKTGSSTSYSR